MKKKTPKIPANILKSLIGFRHQDIKEKEENSRQLKSTAAHYLSDSKRYKEIAKESILRAKAIEMEIAILEAAIDRVKDKEESEEVWASLWRHSIVENVEFNQGNIEVTTKLLFQNIRKEGGSDEKMRACLGAFKLIFPLNTNRVYIENITFPSDKDTWAISSHSPCLGEWATDFQRVFAAKDYMGLIDLCFHFIRAADTDDGAFMRSHHWRDQKRKLLTDNSSFEVGDHIVCTDMVDGMYNTIRCVGIVTEGATGNLRPRVSFKAQNIEGVVTAGGYRLVVEPEFCVKITKKQYDSCLVMAELPKIKKNNDNKNLLQKIDKLKDGSTQKDVDVLVAKAKA